MYKLMTVTLTAETVQYASSMLHETSCCIKS